MNKVWCLLICSSVMGVTALSQSPSAQSGLLFETTFNCPDWNQASSGLLDNSVCASGDGIAGFGAWTSSNGRGDQITAAANNPAGGGGKGLRHWRGNGSNNGGGGLNITLPRSVTEMWVRLYMRFQTGFSWSGGHPGYTKDNYWGGCGSGCVIFGYQGGAWGINYNGAVNYPSSMTWEMSQGGPAGDGQWHSYEYHLRQNGSSAIIELWVDGVRYLNNRAANLGSTPWQSFNLGSNQSSVTNCPNDCYTDYDDLAISTTGYIGPIGGLSSGGGGGGLPAAPVNLRIVP